MAKVKYRVREYTPTANQGGAEGYDGAAGSRLRTLKL